MSDYLKPIAGDNPAGIDLRYTDKFDALREMRREDDHGVSYGIWESELKHADWEDLQEQCAKILMEESKDLRILGWLIECWMIKQGALKGLQDGLVLLQGFLESFWEQHFPLDPIHRVSIFDWMDRAFTPFILKVQLNDNPLTTVNLAVWRDAVFYDHAIRRDPDVEEELEDKGKLTLEACRNVLKINAVAFTNDMLEQCKHLLSALNGIIEILSQRYTKEPPSFPELRKALQDVIQILMTEKPIPPAEPQEETSHSESTEAIPEAPKKAIHSRDDAYRALQELTAYIRYVDPHSPVPHLLDVALSWQHKDLMTILSELKSTQDPKFEILRLLGRAING